MIFMQGKFFIIKFSTQFQYNSKGYIYSQQHSEKFINQYASKIINTFLRKDSFALLSKPKFRIDVKPKTLLQQREKMIINQKYFSQKCPRNRRILKVDINILQKFGYKQDDKKRFYKIVDGEKIYALLYKGEYYICDKIVPKNMIQYIESK
jgi:hypothetical protein